MNNTKIKTDKIGNVDLKLVIDQAKELEKAGGPAVPQKVSDISELGISSPADITRITRLTAKKNGSIVMSSGGTTGEPKLTFVPYSQGIERMLRSWRPLEPHNVMLNLFNPGRLWGSHYYMLALAEGIKCTVIPMGAIFPQEVEGWASMLRDVGTDSVAGTPTAISTFCEGLIAAKISLPIKNVIWVGEAWTEKKEQTVRTALPEVAFWGNYGSIETFVIASNTPKCPISIFHLHPDEMLELDPEGALLTRVGAGWTVATVRYRLGDKISAAKCPCGRENAFIVVGRADDSIKFRGTLFSIGSLLSFIRTQAGIDDVQLILYGSKEAGSVNRMTVRITGRASSNTIQNALLKRFVDLDVKDSKGLHTLIVESVSQLKINERTHKVPPAVWEIS